MAAKGSIGKAAAGLEQVDGALQEAFGPQRDSLPVKLLGLAGELGDQPQLRLLSGACIAAGLLTSDRRMVRAGTRMLLAHELATLAKNMVKDNVDRTRPRSATSQSQRRPKRGHHSDKDETSFPSGHTAGSLAVARAFAREYSEHGAEALGAAGLIAAAQVPQCAHYVTDVGAGALIGLVAEAAAGAILPVPEASRSVPRRSGS